MGFTFMLGVEPEFFLIEKKADGTPAVADPADTLDKPCYGQLSLLRNADFLTTIISHLNELGYGVYPK
jgi:glutamine synthetase